MDNKIFEFFNSSNEIEHERKEIMLKKEEKYKNNLKHLQRKSKEFNESIPDELLATIIVDQPRGASFFAKFKKWIDD